MAAASSGDFSGWLLKRAVRTATKDNWKKRWCVLSASKGTFAYFESPTSRSPKHSLTLTANSTVRSVSFHVPHELEIFFGSAGEAGAGTGKDGGNLAVYASPITTGAGANPAAEVAMWVEKIQAVIMSLQTPLTAAELAARTSALEAAQRIRNTALSAEAADRAARTEVIEQARHAERERAATLKSLRLSIRTMTGGSAAALGLLGAEQGQEGVESSSSGSSSSGRATLASKAPSPSEAPSPGAAAGGRPLSARFASLLQPGSAASGASTAGTAASAGATASAKTALQQLEEARSATLWAAGANDLGQCGIGGVTTRGITRPMLVESLKGIREIAAGTTHAAAISFSNQLFMWGSNAEGQCGMSREKLPSLLKPTLVPSFKAMRVLSVACGTYHSLAITEGGRVWAWGTGMEGQLGLGSGVTFSAEPRQVHLQPALVDDHSAAGASAGVGAAASLSSLVSGSHIQQLGCKVSAGRYTSAVVTDRGELQMMGSGEWGRMGLGHLHCGKETIVWEPLTVAALMGRQVQQAVCGDIFTAVLCSPLQQQAGAAVAVAGLSPSAGGAAAAAAAESSSLTDSSVSSSALSSAPAQGFELLVMGALGLTADEWRARVTAVTWPHRTATFESRPVCKQISAGRAHLAAVLTDGSVYTSGRGWLGSSGEDYSTDLVAVSELDLEGVEEVACGSLHTVARTRDGRLFVFGANSTGCCMQGGFAEVPTAVPSMCVGSQSQQLHVSKVACGADFTLSLALPGSTEEQLHRLAGGGMQGQGEAAAAQEPQSIGGKLARFFSFGGGGGGGGAGKAGSGTASASPASSTSSTPRSGGSASASGGHRYKRASELLPGVFELLKSTTGDRNAFLGKRQSWKSKGKAQQAVLQQALQEQQKKEKELAEAKLAEEAALKERLSLMTEEEREQHLSGAGALAPSVFTAKATNSKLPPPPTFAAPAMLLPPPPPLTAAELARLPPPPSTAPPPLPEGSAPSPAAAAPAAAASPATPAMSQAAAALQRLHAKAAEKAVAAPEAPGDSADGAAVTAVRQQLVRRQSNSGLATAKVQVGAAMALPAGWARYTDEEGDAYFHHSASNRSTWQLFWQLQSPDGESYYVNVESKQSQWERPDESTEGGAVVVPA